MNMNSDIRGRILYDFIKYVIRILHSFVIQYIQGQDINLDI